MNKLFEVKQKITLLVNEYHVLKDGEPVAFVKQKRFALREHFSLFKDQQQSEILVSSQARQAIDLASAFDVTDKNGKHLATLKKDFKKSLFRSSWSIYQDKDMSSLAFTLQEKSQAVALFRRLWGFIPYLSDIPFPIKFHFSILKGQKVVGEYTKLTVFRDHYALYLEDSVADKLDERAWMIMSVLLDAMQHR
jgi:uncharacterized protein YxjI